MLLLGRNRLLHLNSWFYFLILIDELFANAAGDYLLEGKEKFGINFESHRSRLDVLAAHKQKPGHIYIQGGILNAAKCPRGLPFGTARNFGIWTLARGRQRRVREASCYLWLSSCMSVLVFIKLDNRK